MTNRNRWNSQKTTPVWFEHTLPKEMPDDIQSRIAGHRVNHSAKVPWLLVENLWLMLLLNVSATIAGCLGGSQVAFVCCYRVACIVQRQEKEPSYRRNTPRNWLVMTDSFGVLQSWHWRTRIKFQIEAFKFWNFDLDYESRGDRPVSQLPGINATNSSAITGARARPFGQLERPANLKLRP